jgi:hypothetical protein
MKGDFTRWRSISAIVVLVLILCVSASVNTEVSAQITTTPRVATPAPATTVSELSALVEQARTRFVARDAAGVMAYVAEDYRSAGITKPGLRDQLLALYALYDQLQARIRVDQVQLVDGDAWVYTTGEVNGRLPVVGWVTVLLWQREPEVARRQGPVWRLIGFQD